jgi:hypothetical protein
MYAVAASTCATAKAVSRRKTNKVGRRPACKHCENLKVSSNHWLRSLDGKIVCPRLLATECRYCHERGHTVKNCQELQAKNTLIPVAAPKTVKRVVTFPTQKKQGFNILMDTDSEEECMRVVPIHSDDEDDDEDPTTWNGRTTFAQVLKTPPQVMVPKLSLIHPDLLDTVEPDAFPPSPDDYPPHMMGGNKEYTPFASLIADSLVGRDWADLTDSDDDA